MTESVTLTVPLKPGDYWLTSLGDGKGKAIVTTEGRLLVEQFPDERGKTVWADLTEIYPFGSRSWIIEERV